MPRALGAAKVASAITLGGATLTTVSLVLPWATSGRRSRSAFELLRVVRDLGLIEGSVPRAVIGAVFVVPVMTALAWVLVVAGRPQFAGGVVTVVAALVLAAAVSVLRSPLRSGPGVPIGMAGCAVAVAGVAAVVWTRKER
jgi:hypothetical protein